VPTQLAVSGVPVMIHHQPLQGGTKTSSFRLTPTVGSLYGSILMFPLHCVTCSICAYMHYILSVLKRQVYFSKKHFLFYA